jgi:hypothetical protein
MGDHVGIAAQGEIAIQVSGVRSGVQATDHSLSTIAMDHAPEITIRPV